MGAFNYNEKHIPSCCNGTKLRSTEHLKMRKNYSGIMQLGYRNINCRSNVKVNLKSKVKVKNLSFYKQQIQNNNTILHMRDIPVIAPVSKLSHKLPMPNQCCLGVGCRKTEAFLGNSIAIFVNVTI